MNKYKILIFLISALYLTSCGGSSSSSSSSAVSGVDLGGVGEISPL